MEASRRQGQSIVSDPQSTGLLSLVPMTSNLTAVYHHSLPSPRLGNMVPPSSTPSTEDSINVITVNTGALQTATRNLMNNDPGETGAAIPLAYVMDTPESGSDPGCGASSVESGTATRCSVHRSESSGDTPGQALSAALIGISQGSTMSPVMWARCMDNTHGAGHAQFNYEEYYDRLRQVTDADVPLTDAEDISLARGMYTRPCDDCRLFTGNWCDGITPGERCLASNWTSSGTWGTHQGTPLCSICDRHFASCHYCRVIAWCRPAVRHHRPPL